MIILNKQILDEIRYTCDLSIKNDNNKIITKDNNCDTSSLYGKVIIAPPASGKSYFVKNQFNRDIFLKNVEKSKTIKKETKNEVIWFDMDTIFRKLNLNWIANEKDEVEFKRTYERADYLIEQCRRFKFNLIGCLYYKFIPDAITILPEYEHNIYINMRKDLNNRKHIIESVKDDLLNINEKHYVPLFTSIIEAVDFVESENSND